MLHVIIKQHALVQHFFDGLGAEDGVRVITYPYVKHSRGKSFLRSIEAYLLWWLPHSWFLDADYLAKLRAIQPDDAVLFFSMENRKTLQIIRKLVSARKQSAWFWDPIRSYRKSPLSRFVYKQWLKHSGLQARTFDPRDAREFDIGLIEQVFRHDPPAGGTPDAKDIDMYFIGTDKGRMDELMRWKELFERDGRRTHFHIVGDRRKVYSPERRALVTDAWIPYAANIALARRAKVILELLQGTQSGPTMRAIEALFFGSKLITNNLSIVECEFYDPSRVFVIGRDRTENLKEFLDTPAAPASAALLRRHEIRTWLDQFR